MNKKVLTFCIFISVFLHLGAITLLHKYPLKGRSQKLFAAQEELDFEFLTKKEIVDYVELQSTMTSSLGEEAKLPIQEKESIQKLKKVEIEVDQNQPEKSQAGHSPERRAGGEGERCFCLPPDQHDSQGD